MNARKGWNTEQVRNESYREVIADDKKLNESKLTVLWQLVDGPKTLQEISEITGMKEHLVSARLNGLREDKWVYSEGKKRNPFTNKNNSLWHIDPVKFKPVKRDPMQIKIF